MTTCPHSHPSTPTRKESASLQLCLCKGWRAAAWSWARAAPRAGEESVLGPAVTPAPVPALETSSCSLCLPCRTTQELPILIRLLSALAQWCEHREAAQACHSVSLSLNSCSRNHVSHSPGDSCSPWKRCQAPEAHICQPLQSRDRKALPSQVKISAHEEYRTSWWQHYPDKAKPTPQREAAQHLQHVLMDHCSDLLPHPTRAKTFRSSPTPNIHHNTWIIY